MAQWYQYRAKIGLILYQLKRVAQIRIRALVYLLPTLNHGEIGISRQRGALIVKHVRIETELRLIFTSESVANAMV